MRLAISLAIAGAAIGLRLPSSFATVATFEGLPAVIEPVLHSCPGTVLVAIRASAAADAEMACEGVERALEFLARSGFGPPPSTTIEIVSELPGELGGRAVGCYLRQTRNILILTYESFQAGAQWFRMPADRDLYRAAAAHEMAHAVVGCHSEPVRLPVAAHEYVAYVVMFATLDPPLRERILAKFPGAGFTSTVQINEITHLVNPNQFGADSWRHYLRRRDRSNWLREIIAGHIVEELPSEGPQ
jgi:hypothetical protein